jgi:hypothetical protein
MIGVLIRDRDTAILAHYPSVRRITLRIAQSAGRLDIFEDLVSIGTVALIDAIDLDIVRHNLLRSTTYAHEIALAVTACVVEANTDILYRLQESLDDAFPEKEEC